MRPRVTAWMAGTSPATTVLMALSQRGRVDSRQRTG
jgi:hypothetical protein